MRLLVAWCLCDEVIVWYGRVLVGVGGTFIIGRVLALVCGRVLVWCGIVWCQDSSGDV